MPSAPMALLPQQQRQQQHEQREDAERARQPIMALAGAVTWPAVFARLLGSWLSRLTSRALVRVVVAGAGSFSEAAYEREAAYDNVIYIRATACLQRRWRCCRGQVRERRAVVEGCRERPRADRAYPVAGQVKLLEHRVVVEGLSYLDGL
jgi:hypothetical protein